MHICPHDPRLNCSSYCCLRLKYRSVDLALLLSELTTHWESHRLVSNVAIPFAPQIEKDHLPLLNQLVVVDIVQGGAISPA
jgi:hypothetical protein